ncbi:MAG: hypothetical protein F4171_02315, partial [Gammaproteobacteria bacterium]|nr:hypothetical protein [Gammaproteobacteria bacterium]MYG11622.1 hypothetical protein [Gammaproteobacteria bacterium]MYK28843.1 hypothetical protein [Gammaproteobacteria bacterium]
MAFSGQDCIKLAAWPKQVGIGHGSGVVALWLLAAASLGEPLAELGASQPEKGATSASMHSGSAQLLEIPPLGLPPAKPPRPLAQASIDLGRRLFFDRRLSFNQTLSCGMCHIPE